MNFDNLVYDVLLQIMKYVSIQDRFENISLVSKKWKSVAQDSLRRERKLIVNLEWESWPKQIEPTEHHSIINFTFTQFDPGQAWKTGINRYLSHVFFLCPNLE